MTTTTHTAIGSIIGLTILNPILGFTIGLISHFLVDIIPHGDGDMRDDEERELEKKNYKVIAYGAVDVLIAFFFLLLIVNIRQPEYLLPLTAAIAGSVLPDLIVGLHDVTQAKILKPFVQLHWFFHDMYIKRYKDIKLSYALASQAGFIAAACIIIF